jgi:hypothetical protein
MKLTSEQLKKIIQEELEELLLEKKKKSNKICDKGIAWAKRTFDTYPSAYANLAASKYCKDPNYAKDSKKRSKKNESLDEGELQKWVDEDWVRVTSSGKIAGKCGTSKDKKNPDRCLPRSKAQSMSKGERAATGKKKKSAQKSGKDSGKTSNVSNTKKGKVTKAHTKRNESIQEQKNCGCGQDPCKTYGKVNEEFKPHDMFDPKTGKKKTAKVEKDHHDLAKRGYTHVDPDEILRLIDKEGGALGIKNLTDKFGEDQKAEILKTIKAMSDVGQHEEGDYIRADDKEIDVVKEEEMEEAKKKKPCKPSKGKRFAKRVNGKCRSFGQKGQAKGGGDRIRPGTKKGDAYCARSAKIKKCKNPPCANDLSRKKWKCRGSKSMREDKG